MLTIDSCPLFNQWDVVAQLNRLHSLSLIGLNSETIENALNSISSSALVNSLVSLSLTQNGLTQVPPQIQELSKLQNLYLSTNEISKASNGSLAFTTPLRNLQLTSNGLTTIEPAAFQGISHMLIRPTRAKST
jgi:Leucine-rich repeat (LRR) protein